MVGKCSALRISKEVENHKENLSSGKFSATSNHRVPYPYPRIRIRICPYPGPSCLHLHPSTLRGRQRISPIFFIFHLQKFSLSLAAAAVRRSPPANFQLLGKFSHFKFVGLLLVPRFFLLPPFAFPSKSFFVFLGAAALECRSLRSTVRIVEGIPNRGEGGFIQRLYCFS